METINGEWIMKGCDSSDPSALHSTEELISIIHTIGFLALWNQLVGAVVMIIGVILALFPPHGFLNNGNR